MMVDPPQWLPPDEIPSDEAWKPPPDLSRSQRAAEQDTAAGGRDRRIVHFKDGRTATASVELKRLPRSRRVYGYLRYSSQGRTVNRYIGDTTAHTRLEALEKAWCLAHHKGLLGT